MHGLLHWFAEDDNALAALVTANVALLIICCLVCTRCSTRDKDEIFRRHTL
jgi:hypothetical protein